MDIDEEEGGGEHHHLAVHDEARAAAGVPNVPTDNTVNLLARSDSSSQHISAKANGAAGANSSSNNDAVDRIRLTRPPLDPHHESVDRRRSELEWLRSLVSSIAPDEIRHVVAHRGFHSVKDRSDRRPLENSLSAYESAWISGVHLCECDIALTKDEKLILAHDEDFRRLALDPSSPLCNKKVTELTFREIMACPLKTGSRPPLLIDVLRSAWTIGGESRLIIEIKPGNSEAGTALARMFMRHPELMDRCAVVMSFDAFAIHTLRREMAALERAGYGSAAGGVVGVGVGVGVGAPSAAVSGAGMNGGAPSVLSLPTAMSLGNLGMRIDSFQTQGGQSTTIDPYATGAVGAAEDDGEEKKEREDEKATAGGMSKSESIHGSSDHFGVGLGERSREDSFHFSPFGQSQLQPKKLKEGEVLEDGGASSSAAIEDVSPSLVQEDDDERPPELQRPPSTSAPEATRATHHDHSRYPPPHPPRPGMPHLLLLTVSDPPAKECELQLDVSSSASRSQVDSWLRCSDGSLHGVYLQFQREMLEPAGIAGLRELTERGYLVGVWGHNGRDPDDYTTFHKLVREAGVSFVNSDLPRRFKMGDVGAHRGVSFGL